MGVWHKYDGINTMAQKGAKAPNDTAPGLGRKKAGGFHPPSKRVGPKPSGWSKGGRDTSADDDGC